MGDGTEKNPYTREDMLRLIEENGGTAEGLDLSDKHFDNAIDLRELNLKGIILVRANLEDANLMCANLESADLVGANLRGAILGSAHLQRTKVWNANLEGADLRGAHLEGAILMDTNLEEAELGSAHLEGADLRGARLNGAYWQNVEFTSDTKLDDVDWGNYVLGQESFGDIFILSTYRRLKAWYTQHGMYDIAGEFFFREMTARRRQMAWWPNPIHRTWSKFISLICGYGEKPLRVVGWAVSVVLGSAFIYFAIDSAREWRFFGDYLYFSAVSFTALGYGSWLQVTNNWIKGIGAFESFIGVFSIALFLVTFTRKMTR